MVARIYLILCFVASTAFAGDSTKAKYHFTDTTAEAVTLFTQISLRYTPGLVAILNQLAKAQDDLAAFFAHARVGDGTVAATMSALEFAASTGNVEAFACLLEYARAFPELRVHILRHNDALGASAVLFRALENGHDQIVLAFLDFAADDPAFAPESVRAMLSQTLIFAIRFENIRLFQMLLDRIRNRTFRDLVLPPGTAPLVEAVRNTGTFRLRMTADLVRMADGRPDLTLLINERREDLIREAQMHQDEPMLLVLQPVKSVQRSMSKKAILANTNFRSGF